MPKKSSCINTKCPQSVAVFPVSCCTRHLSLSLLLRLRPLHAAAASAALTGFRKRKQECWIFFSVENFGQLYNTLGSQTRTLEGKHDGEYPGLRFVLAAVLRVFVSAGEFSCGCCLSEGQTQQLSHKLRCYLMGLF